MEESERTVAGFASALERVMSDKQLIASSEELAARLNASGGVQAAVDAIDAHFATDEHSVAAQRQSSPIPQDGQTLFVGSTDGNEGAEALVSVVSLVREVAGDDYFEADTELSSLNSLEALELLERLRGLSSVAAALPYEELLRLPTPRA